MGRALLKDSNKYKRATSIKIILEFLILSLNRHFLTGKVLLKMKANPIFIRDRLQISPLKLN